MPKPSMIAALSLAPLLCACGPPPFSEAMRATDPTGRIDAVGGILETDATVDTPTVVFLTRAGTKAKGDRVFSADHVDGLSLKWLSDHELSIRADRARTYRSDSERVVHIEGGERTVRLTYDIRTSEPLSRVEDYR